VGGHGGLHAARAAWHAAGGYLRARHGALRHQHRRDPAFFPDLSTTLIEGEGQAEFIRLNAIILKACDPHLSQRYASAGEMHRDLLNAQNALEPEAKTQGNG